MAIKRWRKKAIVAAIETTYGTDAEPTGADAILATNVTLRAMEGEDRNRDLDRPYLGAQGNIPVNTHVTLEFEVEMAGAGTAGDAPAYGTLLRACGLSETITAETDVRYAPVSEDFESASIYINIDGTLHKITGARATVTLPFEASQIPRFRFSMRGLFSDPVDEAAPTVDYSAFTNPTPVSHAATPTFTIDDAAMVMERCEIQLGQQVEGRFLVGSEDILIVDREATGSTVIQATELATFDPWSKAKAPKTPVDVELVHGNSDGRIVEILLPRAEIGRPEYGETQGIVNWTVPLTFIPSNAGDDELEIVVR